MTNINNISSLSSLLNQNKIQNKQSDKDIANADFSDLLQSFSKTSNNKPTINDDILNSSSNKIMNSDFKSPNFASSFLNKHIDSLNNMYIKADKSQAEVAAGYGDPLQATLDVNRADLNFKLMMEIRNKAIGAFKEITRIQV